MSDSIGAALVAARTAKGVSLAEAASQLHCDESLLLALESDRFEELGAPVFVQGHLRRYADYLGASTESLMSAWAKLRAEKLTDPDLARIPRAPARAVDPKLWTRRAMVLGITVVIALAAWLILGLGSTNAPVVTAVPASVETPAVSAAVTKAAPTAAPSVVTQPPAVLQPLAPTVPVSGASPATLPPPVSSPAASLTTVSPPVTTSGVSTLRFVPRERTWIEVYDAANRRRYYGMAAADTPLSLRGDAPFRVVVGRANTVAIELDGRPIPLPSSLISNSTAFISIDAAGNVQRAAARNTGSPTP